MNDVDPPSLDATELRSGSIEPGTMVDGYKILSAIGEGGFGVVYLAESEKPLRRRVALKVIKPGMDSKQVIARFEAERQALAIMDHPNIARVINAGTTPEGRPYFAMELVKGVPLTEYCDSHRVPIRERLELFASVCRAVQHAHQKGVIHRDLKPSNVLVVPQDDRPVAKVIDFGVAKAINQPLTESTLYTAQGQMVGTPQYMSPEQAEVSAVDIDTRSDIYSLGAMLYQLLTGVTPLSREQLRSSSYAEVQKLIREEEPLPPSARLTTLGDTLATVAGNRGTDTKSLSYDVRGDLDWIVLKALEKERSRRYDTANSFADDIERYLRDEEVEARPPSATYRLQKFARRNKGPLVAATAIGVILLFATVVSTWQAVEARRERNRAQLDRDRARLAEKDADSARREAVQKQQVLQDTLNQLHSALIDKVYLEMAGGDEDKVEAAIVQAELAGVPEEQLQFFRAQMAVYYGRPSDAIEILAPLEESNVAALGMLATAKLHGGDITAFEDTLATLQRVVADADTLSPEDRLFAAHALMETDPLRAEKLIDGVLDERNSPLARLINANILSFIAQQTQNPDTMAEALSDLNAAITFGADAPSFAGTQFWVKHCGVILGGYEYVKPSEDELSEYRSKVSRNPIGRMWLVRYLTGMNDVRALELIDYWPGPTTDVEMIFYVPILLEHQTPRDVLAYIESQESLGPYSEAMKTRILALAPERRTEARELVHRLINKETHSVLRVHCLQALLLMGDLQEATEQARRLFGTSDGQLWNAHENMKYIADFIDGDTLLASSSHLRMNEHEARFALAIKQCAEGDRDAGLANLRECVNMRIIQLENYWFARAFLKAIESKRDWVDDTVLGEKVKQSTSDPDDAR